jgi:hypothetical protein
MRGLPLVLFWAGYFLNSGQLPPRSYEALRTPTPPIIDGRLSDPSWEAASWSEDFVDIRGAGEKPPHLRTRVKLLWDEDFLFVGAELEEPHLWATLTERDDIIYRDDDFEVFLDPDGDGEAYFEVEINAMGTVLDLFLDKPYREGGSAVIRWDLTTLQSAISLQGTLNDPSDEDEGWTVELAIPWDGLTPPGATSAKESSSASLETAGQHHLGIPTPGDEWRVNFSRVDWPLRVVSESASGELHYEKSASSTRALPHPEHNWVWSPQGVINMHIPEMWGIVRFVEPPPSERIR